MNIDLHANMDIRMNARVIALSAMGVKIEHIYT